MHSPSLRPLLLLIGLFLVATVPMIDGVVHYHGDEQYYTDAAIQMIQTGDWWTPRWEDGTPRFNKPILPYWFTAAGFRLLGIRYAGARILFLVAGAITIWLTYRLGRTLFRDRTAALTAAAIVASSQEMRDAALRAMPDILISLFLGVALLGFSRVLFLDRPRPRDALLGWAGAGLAAASKGLLGVVVVVFILGFARWRRRGTGHLLLAPGGVLVGLVTGLAWYAGIVALHGPAAVGLFWHDQVGTRVGASALTIAGNALQSLLVTVRGFLPWSAMALAGFFAGRRAAAAALIPHRRAVELVLAWSLLLTIIFAAPIHSTSRYFLPAHLGLATLTGAWLTALARSPGVGAMLRRWRRPLVMASVLAGLLVTAVGWRLDLRISTWGAVMTIGSLGLARAIRRPDARRTVLSLAAWLLLVAGGYDVLVRPVLSVSPAPAMTRRLLELGAAGQPVETLDVASRQIGQIRVLSGGTIWPTPRPADGSARAPFAIARETRCGDLEPDYDVRPCGWRYRKVRAADLLQILRRGREAVLPGLRIEYCVGSLKK